MIVSGMTRQDYLRSVRNALSAGIALPLLPGENPDDEAVMRYQVDAWGATAEVKFKGRGKVWEPRPLDDPIGLAVEMLAFIRPGYSGSFRELIEF